MKEVVYWKQRDGKMISVDDMDINHLRNTLKMIIKNNKPKKVEHRFEPLGEICAEDYDRLLLHNIDPDLLEDEFI